MKPYLSNLSPVPLGPTQGWYRTHLILTSLDNCFKILYSVDCKLILKLVSHNNLKEPSFKNETIETLIRAAHTFMVK